MTNYSIGSRPSDTVRIEDTPVHAGEISPLSSGLTSVALSNRPLQITLAPNGGETSTAVVTVSPQQLLDLAGMQGPHSTDDRVNALSRYILADLRHQAGPHSTPADLSRMVHTARELAVRTLSTLHHAAEHTDALRPGVSADTPLTVRLTGTGAHGAAAPTQLVSDWFEAPIADAVVPAPTPSRTSSRHIDSPTGRHGHRSHAAATTPTPVRLSADQLAELQHDLGRFERAAAAGQGLIIERRDGGRAIEVSPAHTRAIADALRTVGERLFLAPEHLSPAERAETAHVRSLIDTALHHNRAAISAFWRGDTTVDVQHGAEVMESERLALRAESDHALSAPHNLHVLAEQRQTVTFDAQDGRSYSLDPMALRRLEASWHNSRDALMPVVGFEAQLRRELSALGYNPTDTDLQATARTLMATLSDLTTAQP